MPMPTTTTNPPATCYCDPPVLYPPSCPHPELVSDTSSWDLIDDEDEDHEYHIVDRNQFKNNASLRKLLETYEFVQPHHHFSAVAVDEDHLKYAQSVTPNTILPDLNNNNNSSPSQRGRRNDLDKVAIIYITSMRGIRKTYDDCRAIKSILDGFRVAVDLRDIAMDLKYRRELQRLLAQEGKAIPVPQLFIGANHIGGADQVRRLQESGELSKLLEGCPIRDSTLVPCVCGDARFVLCAHCSGSKKLFDEHRKSKKCSHCNENGLVECPSCKL